jgi:hypothetical protein
MGSQVSNQNLAGSVTDATRQRQIAQQQLEADRDFEKAKRSAAASMFPNEPPAPAGTQPPSGFEEAVYRRGELTRERDRSGRRRELFRNFQQATGEGAEVAPGGAVERGAGLFGAPFGGAGQGPRSGIVFGPGRANRMPEQGTPEYQALLERTRLMGRG